MLLDCTGSRIFIGDVVKFTPSPDNPYGVNTPTFVGRLLPTQYGAALKNPYTKGYIIFIDDGEPCYELMRMSNYATVTPINY